MRFHHKDTLGNHRLKLRHWRCFCSQLAVRYRLEPGMTLVASGLASLASALGRLDKHNNQIRFCDEIYHQGTHPLDTYLGKSHQAVLASAQASLASAQASLASALDKRNIQIQSCDEIYHQGTHPLDKYLGKSPVHPHHRVVSGTERNHQLLHPMSRRLRTASVVSQPCSFGR
jgi:hypothetical protein